MTMPKYFADCWDGSIGHYGYMNAKDHIHVEVEPTDQDQHFIIEEIRVKRLIKKENKGGKPQMFLLGDSTVKNYVFEELPMNGRGMRMKAIHHGLDVVQQKKLMSGHLR